MPASSGRAGSRPFAAARRESETPLRAAMPLSVSPRRTTSPPPPLDEVAAVVAGADVEMPVPSAGIVRLVPAMTRASGDRPLAAARALADRPLAEAMPHSVSPGATRWPAARAGVVGSSAAAMSAAPARRTVRSIRMA